MTPGAAPPPEPAPADRPRRFVVKVCGVTRLEDATLACELGADRIGFILADSPRRATLEQVATITPSLPDTVTPTGVFVNASPEEIAAAFDAGIRLAQLHGDEDTAWCEALGLPYTKVIRVQTGDDVRRALDYACDEVLVEAKVDGRYGGPGVPLPDDIVDAALALDRRVMLAGGLGPANVFAALEHAHRTPGRAPYGIDASSSLEASPGHKDPDKLRRFFAEIDRFIEETVA